MTSPVPPTWSSLRPALHESVLEAVAASFGFATMTPVQAATIPVFMTGTRDVAVQACTGSGKTLAFLVPIVEILLRRPEPWRPHEVGAVVIAPTRELAQQIYSVAVTLLEQIPDLHVAALVGGSLVSAPISGANIAVATPGRLEETLKSDRRLDFRAVDVVVLDEADRLLDMGFATSLSNILARLPKQRRTGLFSATQSGEVESLVRAGLRNPTRIDVRVRRKSSSVVSQATPTTLTNAFLVVPPERKLAQLVDLLKAHHPSKVIVFVLTCAMVDYLGAILPLLISQPIRALHGRLKQSARTRLLGAFTDDLHGGVLIATDVVARGIDIDDVDLIVQFDPPQDPSIFVHRVGRTARMGRAGAALVLLLETEREYVDLLAVRNVPLTESSLALVDEAGAAKVVAEIRRLALGDRDLVDRAQRALVAFVRGYKEHLCSYIFQLGRLPMTSLAKGFGLLFLPRMPELVVATADREAFDGANIHPDSIPYRDAARERQRQATLAERQAARGAAHDQRARDRKRAEERLRATTKLRRKRKQSANQDRIAEWDDLAVETHAYKKLRKRKLTTREFEVLVGERGADDDVLR